MQSIFENPKGFIQTCAFKNTSRMNVIKMKSIVINHHNKNRKKLNKTILFIKPIKKTTKTMRNKQFKVWKITQTS